jgi:hypothetical protein
MNGNSSKIVTFKPNQKRLGRDWLLNKKPLQKEVAGLI